MVVLFVACRRVQVEAQNGINGMVYSSRRLGRKTGDGGVFSNLPRLRFMLACQLPVLVDL
jgi:hypothetical protein